MKIYAAYYEDGQALSETFFEDYDMALKFAEEQGPLCKVEVIELIPKKAPIYENVKCPDCGGEMTSRSSKYGTFWGCKAYPKCRGTRDSEGLSKAEREAQREPVKQQSGYGFSRE